MAVTHGDLLPKNITGMVQGTTITGIMHMDWVKQRLANRTEPLPSDLYADLNIRTQLYERFRETRQFDIGVWMRLIFVLSVYELYSATLGQLD